MTDCEWLENKVKKPWSLTDDEIDWFTDYVGKLVNDIDDGDYKAVENARQQAYEAGLSDNLFS